MNIEKFPRWALITLATIGMGSCWILISTARADLDKFKNIAYTAKSNADDALALGNELKVQIADVRGAQETFRKEYREDRNKDSEILRSMEDRIIRAVKS